MKIAICGKMCAGKSTLADMLINNYPSIKFTKDSFASKIYELAYELFNMKEKDRELLQTLGTKMREINPQVWVNYIEQKYKGNHNIIIDDARYPNELEMLKKNGFYIIKLNISYKLQEQRIRKLYKDTYQLHLNKRNHASETSMDFLDDRIFNLVVDVDNENLEHIVKTQLCQYVDH